MPNTHSTLTSLFQDIADSIRQKTGASPSQKIVADNFPTEIANIPTGSSVWTAVGEKDVNFYDYDGTCLYSYTASEFANLTELPANPSHTGLIAQGWNWTLSDAKTHVASYGYLMIGQMYITDDEKTRLYVTVDDIARPDVTIRFGCRPANCVTIDWGDSSATQTSTESAAIPYTHTYSQTGDYVIKLSVASGGSLIISGNSSNRNNIMGNGNDATRYNSGRLKKVELGARIDSNRSYAFYYCESLKYVTIPNESNSYAMSSNMFNNALSLHFVVVPKSMMGGLGSSIFYNCRSLRGVCLPETVITVDASAFYNCYALSNLSLSDSTESIGGSALSGCQSLCRFKIPSSITSIGSGAFSSNYSETVCRIIPSGVSSVPSSCFTNNYSIVSVIIPSSVTSIGSSAFSNCLCVKEYHLQSTTPPTLQSVNVFYGIPSDCIIYVPKSTDQTVLNAYKTATSWSTYASYIQEES